MLLCVVLPKSKGAIQSFDCFQNLNWLLNLLQ